MSATKKDWLTDERKLQPVYEDIQEARLKPALSQVDRLLKKQPRSQPALILRAYLLNQQGAATEDVLKVWKSVEATGELSPRSMWWAGLLMRNIGRSDILLDLYVKLWDARPDSSEIGQQVVLLSVSLWNTSLMCSSSRKMFNLLKTTTWARLAAWAEWADKTAQTPIPADQVFPAPPPANSLRIAATLLSTTRKACPSPEALWLHAQIYLAAGQEEAALALVKEEGVGGGGVGRGWWRIKTVQEVLRRMAAKGEGGDDVRNVVKEEMGVFSKVLRENPDMQRNWANYDHLLQLISYDASIVTEVKALFTDLDTSIGTKERAPALALLHLDARAEEGRMSEADFREAIERYWRRWGSKGLVVDDLKHIWVEREGPMAGLLQAWSEEDHTDISSYLAGKHARLLMFRLKANGWKATEEEFVSTWAYYLAGTTYAANLPKSDVRPADEIGLAAVQILLYIWYQAKDEEYRERHLLRAIVCLRKICDDSPACMMGRYLLIRLYRLIGAPSLVVAPLEQLGMREIQLDTLLHVFSERASVDVLLGQTEAVWVSYKNRSEYMYHKTAADLSEQIKHAVENESYSQITGIRQLQLTLATSLPAAHLAVESGRIASLRRDTAYLAGSVISAELAHARDADEGADTRNWELIPLLVGETSMGEMLNLGGGGRGWVRSWREVATGFVAVVAGGDLSGLVKLEGPSESVLDGASTAERAALEAIGSILRGVGTAFTSDGTESATAEAASLSTVCDGLIQLAKADTGCRWDKLESAMLLVEISRILDVVSGRIAVTVKPKGKNKKVTASPAILEFAKDVEKLESRLKEGRTEVVKTLDGLEKADVELDWVSFAGSAVEAESVERVKKDVVASRRIAIDNLRDLLTDSRK
ncbi:N-acetyltransferase B complex non catalytic subunit-domain-containing protein [Dioszegia hungarica]|uniref:N-acetyltransferase B complex non catalytic subunit-domain-containing protein n=1 Tax=Dioszegia hungarica TaxID=4972 RepID=A0AA38HFJ1_9TREE|nr:N-acetyltransferase B complex non catalytic subunit-domain-containing protein [Dioszegia hungarica]KAI9639157.1 N-acetyltransferase B complex non catalytic subunit-domain-containing protein [Dioszegia hungarica]